MSVNITLPSMDKPLHIVVWQDSNVDGYSSNVTVLTERIAKLEAAIERLTLSSPSSAASEEKKTPLISGIDMKRMPESTGSLSAVHPPDVRNILYNLITQPPMASINKYINHETPSSINNIKGDSSVAPFELDANESETDTAAELELEVEDADDEGDAYADAEEDEANADAEEDDADAVAEEDDTNADAEEDDTNADAEEGAEELEDFEYKGTTYWKDSQNQVYITDESGDLVDQPYGVWSDEKKKVLKYPK